MRNYHYDVIVCGGGMTGVCAALAAKRLGAKVLLIEKNQFFGGMASGAWVHSCLTFHSCKGNRIIAGIPDEIISKLKSIGGSPGHIRDTIGVAYSVTPVNPHLLKYTLHSLLIEAEVDCLMDSVVLEPVLKNSHIAGLKGVTLPSEYFFAHAKTYIDASGDGSLSALAGNPFESGRKDRTQPATLIFTVRGVNLSAVFQFAANHPAEFHSQTHFDMLRKSPAAGLSGFFSIWKQASLPIPRDRLLFYRTITPDEIAVNSTRVLLPAGIKSEDWSKIYYEARGQVNLIVSFLKEKVPGFENSGLSGTAPLLGIREVRRIKGKYILTGEDLAEGKRFDDEIALGGFPIDIHSPASKGIEGRGIGGEGFYGIPYRCLLPQVTPNLIMAGKCFSADFYAHASARVQASCMAMGQAAGTAAALSVKKKILPLELKPNEIRENIETMGGLLNPGRKEDLP